MFDSIATLIRFLGIALAMVVIFQPELKSMLQTQSLKDKAFLADFLKETIIILLFALLTCTLFFFLITTGIIPLPSLLKAETPFILILGFLLLYGGFGQSLLLRYSKLAKQLGLCLGLSAFLLNIVFSLPIIL